MASTLSHFIGNYLEPVADAVYLSSAFICYRKDGWKQARFLCFYYGITVVLMIYASLIVGDASNIWIYNLVGVCTQLFIGLHFYYLLESRVKKVAILVLITLYVLYAFYKYLLLQDTLFFDSVGYSMVSAFICIIVFMYFHQLLTRVTETNILRLFSFWLAAGYLIYFIGSFIVFLSYYYLTTQILSTYTNSERSLMTALWGVHNVLLFISALSLLIGSIWVIYRKPST